MGEYNISNTLDRRLDLLKMEGEGYERIDIVKTLATKYSLSTRALQYDFEKRAHWQPSITSKDPVTNQLRAQNRLEHVYRESAFLFRTSKNENVQLGALNSMRETVRALSELQGLYKIAETPQDKQLKLLISPSMLTYHDLTEQEEKTIAEAYRIMDEKGHQPGDEGAHFMVAKEEVES